MSNRLKFAGEALASFLLALVSGGLAIAAGTRGSDLIGFALLGLALVSFIVAFWAVWNTEQDQTRILLRTSMGIALFGMTVSLVILLFLGEPQVTSSRTSPSGINRFIRLFIREQQVTLSRPASPGTKRFKSLAIAMHAFCDAHGTLPPAAVYGPDGQPLLSWRVLLLPFLDEGELYQQFDLHEAWDGAHNRPLLGKMPKWYAPPETIPAPDPYTTFYKVFVGKGTAFEGKNGIALDDFPDGTSNTILMIEEGEAVPWTKPQDLPYAADGPLPPLICLWKDGSPVASADGSVRFIHNTISEKSLRALITRNGGEDPVPDW